MNAGSYNKLFGLVLRVALFAPGVAVAAAPEQVAPGRYDFSAVDRHLSESIRLYAGNVLVMIRQADELIYQFQLGVIDPNTIVHSASATKWISAGVILSVVESGQYGLDDRVGDYLPLMQSQGKGDITIRQCFTMTSGLFQPLQNFETDPKLTLEQSVNRIALYTPVVFAPGTQLGYHGKGMQVVGLIAQNETGVDWRLLAAQRILTPCAMAHTTYDEFGINPAVAGGIRTTALDYLNYLAMVDQGGVFRGQGVLSPASVAEMFTNQTFGLPIFSSPFPHGLAWYPYGAEDLWYSFGTWVLARNPASGAVEELTGPGAWGTFPWIDKRRGLVGILVSDVPPGTGQAVEPTLHAFELIRQAIDQVTLGDLDCDGAVDFGDINPFVLALTDPEAYGRAYPECEYLNGDLDRDGAVDFGDITPFVNRLGAEPVSAGPRP